MYVLSFEVFVKLNSKNVPHAGTLLNEFKRKCSRLELVNFVQDSL